jgi:RNA polymerase sigma-70 factor, ECF subfamily
MSRSHDDREFTLMLLEQPGPVHANETGIEHINALYGYAMALTRNPSEAEDMVQETYLRALPAMSRLRHQSNIKGWLFKILRNIWLNQFRKRKTSPQIAEIDGESGPAELVDPGKQPDGAYVSKMDAARVREAIDRLPTEFREVILLREFEELSYREIAGLLDCPAGTVMSRLARARSKLRVILSSV